MAEQTARQFLVAALIFGGLIAGAFALISAAMPPGASQKFGEYNTTYNQLADISDNSDDIKDNIEDLSEPESGALGIVNGLIQASWGSIKLSFNTLKTIVDMISQTSSGALNIAIPTWFTGMIIAILGITLTFAIMAAWFKWRI